jgi:hypothetical protein
VFHNPTPQHVGCVVLVFTAQVFWPALVVLEGRFTHTLAAVQALRMLGQCDAGWDGYERSSALS